MKKRLIRWLAVLCTACICQVVPAQKLQKLEYFFDKDPGVSKGALILLPSTAVLDSTFSFDVSALSDGLHLLFIRAQDDSSRWSLSFVTSFVKTTGSSNMLAVSKLEYFFDADPGVGKGMPFTLSSAATVDSLVQLNVSSLADGLHMLYLRAQDASGRWSTTYTSSFIKTTGSDSAVITMVEYFYDVDPGVGNGISLPIKEGNLVEDTLDIPVPDNGADQRLVAARAMDKKGQWSLFYEDSVSLCNLYKAKPAFTWIRYADRYSFIDSTKNNRTGKRWWNFGNLGVDSVSNPEFTFPAGAHAVTLTTGVGCRKDSVTIPLYTGLEKYVPDSTYNNADAVLQFYGGGLDSNVVVTLKNGGTSITPYSKGAQDLKAFKGVFDLHTAPPGQYDVQLHYTNGFDTTITGGLKVLNMPANYAPEIQVQIAGPNAARQRTTVYHDLIITNKSPVAAKGIPVWITADSTVQWSFEKPLNYMPPSTLSPSVLNSIPLNVLVDTLKLGNRTFTARVENLIIPYIAPGQSIVIRLKEVGPDHGAVTTIYARVSQPMFGSPLKANWVDCLKDVVVLGLQFAGIFVPEVALVNCMASLMANFSYDAIQLAIAASEGRANYMNFVQLVAGSLIGCIPGAEVAKLVKASSVIARTLLQIWWDQANIASGTQTATLSLLDDCFPTDYRGKAFFTEHRTGWDPNDIDGPQGYGKERWVKKGERMAYQVYFENLPTATANAQRVFVTDTLNKSKMDLSTFQLLSYGLGDSSIVIPPYRDQYTSTTDLRPAENLLLRLNVKLDTATGVLQYGFVSLDPVTRDTLPLSDIRGFLPPDVNGINGRGMVSFVVDMKPGLSHGSTISNKAKILFDNNPPIETSTWTNTIDGIAPVGTITGGMRINDTTVKLQFSGSDVGSGVHWYRLYGAGSDLHYRMLANVYADSIYFIGKLDSTYHFYVETYDSVGNVARKPAASEYDVTLSRPLPVTLLSFTARKQQTDVLLYWTVATEEKFSHYEVERSVDGNTFEWIGNMDARPGAGTKTYLFADANALVRYSSQKEIFYRLKMVDLDRTAKYSRVAKISLSEKYTVGLHPNPAKGELFVDGLQHYQTFQVSDINGKVIMRKQVTAGMYSINIEPLQGGTYIITLQGADDVQSLKFVKL